MQTLGQSRCSCYAQNSDRLLPCTLGLVFAASISDLEKGMCTPKTSSTASEVHAGLTKTITALLFLILSCLLQMGLHLVSQPTGDNLSGEGGMVLFALCVCVCVYS